MHTVNLLTHLVETHQVFAYAIIYVGLIFEGELFLLSAGVLAHLGALSLPIVLLFVFLGALTKTFLGYEIGGFLYSRFKHHRFFSYIQRRVYTVLPRFKVKPFWSIFVSKFIVGANNVVILFAGYEGINYKKFLKAELFSTLIWAPFLLFLGYVFSYTALKISEDVGRFLLVVLVLFIMFILFDKLVSWLYELSEEFYNENK